MKHCFSDVTGFAVMPKRAELGWQWLTVLCLRNLAGLCLRLYKSSEAREVCRWEAMQLWSLGDEYHGS
jgi:hypothetical protein